MKYVKWVIGGTVAFLLILVLLFTSVELVAFDMSHYEKEYAKYNIATNIDMTEDSLLSVTKSMLNYLQGDRKDLNMKVVINGEYKEMFNEREKAHMVDVQELFRKGFRIRNYSIIGVILLILVILILDKRGIYQILKSIQIALGIIIALAAIMSVLLYIDFNKYFTIFHMIFFTNDLWLLDPRTDLLIRIVPESFFFDTATKIITYFGIQVIVSFVIITGTIRHVSNR